MGKKLCYSSSVQRRCYTISVIQVIFKDLLIFLFWFPVIPTLWKRTEAAFIKCIQWTPKQNKTEPVMLAWWTCTTLWKLINSQTWPEVLMPLLSLGYHRALTDNGSALHNLLPTWKEFQSELSDHKSQGTGMVLPQAVAENCISWRCWGNSSTKLYVLVNTEGLGDEHSKKKRLWGPQTAWMNMYFYIGTI